MKKKMVKLEDMEDVIEKKDHWEKFDALVEVAYVAGQQEEEEEEEGDKKMREEVEEAVALLSLAAEKHGKNLPRPYRQPNMGPPPEMPERFRRKIMEMGGGESVAFVIEKMLFGTDVSAGHNRLSMPMCQIRQDFVTEEERRRLDSTNANINGVEVILVEPCLEENEVMLKKWRMKKTSILYVLIKSWNSVVKRNGLSVGDVVRVWSFRVGSKLGFAVVRVGDEDDEARKGKSTGNKEKDGGNGSGSGSGSGNGSKGKEVEDNGGNAVGSTTHARMMCS